MKLIMVACFRSETCASELLMGEGFTIVEAVVRAVEYSMTEEEINACVQRYGPDDLEGLYDSYLDRGIYLSEVLVLPKVDPRRKTMKNQK